MDLDYSVIGKRVARRRRELGLRQVQVCERAGINGKYLSCIERTTSIPSLEVILKIALVLNTTPDEFLIGSIRHESEEWRDVVGLLRGIDTKQLRFARNLLIGFQNRCFKTVRLSWHYISRYHKSNLLIVF